MRGTHVKLKQLLISEWENYCETKITSKYSVHLNGKFKEYVEGFDFSIVKDISVLRLLEIHRKTPYYHHRFGGVLPSRPIADKPP